MAALDAGPATNSAVLTFSSNAPGVEVHVPAGLPSLSPAFAPYVDPSSAYTGTVLNTTVAGVKFAVPA